MGFGVRGGLGPFRAGIGTNGVSGGVGPFSAWTGWGGGKKPRRNDGDDQVMGWLIVGAMALVVLALPYFGAAWLAEQFGADNPSTVRSVVAWTVEGLWLALIAVFALAAFLVPDEPAAKVPGEHREPEAPNTKQEPLASPALLTRPVRDFPAAATFGHKAEPVLRKAWMGLSDYLDEDEEVLFAARVNKIKPAIELMVITDRRTVACSQNLTAGGRVPFDIPNDTIERFELSKHMDTVTVVLMDGSEVAVGMLASKKDLALMPSDAGV